MSETTLVRDPKLVSVVNKLKTGKIETEIGYAQVGLTVLLGIFFVAVTALGIDKYNYYMDHISEHEKTFYILINIT